MRVLVTSNFDGDSNKNKMKLLAWIRHFLIISSDQWQLANSAVRSRIWMKFETIQDFMHVFVTYKFKKDQTNGNREKVESSIFLNVQGQLIPQSVVRCG